MKDEAFADEAFARSSYGGLTEEQTRALVSRPPVAGTVVHRFVDHVGDPVAVVVVLGGVRVFYWRRSGEKPPGEWKEMTPPAAGYGKALAAWGLAAQTKADGEERRAKDAERRLTETFVAYEADLKHLVDAREKLRVANAGPEDVWRWQGDGRDEPASLSCPVVMLAETLRAMLARAERAEKVETALRDCLSALGAYTDRRSENAFAPGDVEWAAYLAAREKLRDVEGLTKWAEKAVSEEMERAAKERGGRPRRER